MRTKKNCKTLIAVSVMTIIFLLFGERKNSMRMSTFEASEKNISLDLVPIPHNMQSMSINPVGVTKLKLDTSASDELSEFELKEFAKQIKNLNGVNQLDQREFIPSTDTINEDRDYYEANGAVVDVDHKPEMFVHW